MSAPAELARLPASSLEGKLEDAFRVVLGAAIRGGPEYDGISETPARAAKALLEMTSGYEVSIAGLFKTFERDGYDEMIVERGIPFTSLCEHHLLPFTGQVHIAYVPTDRIVGLSKLARLVDAFARRLQVQERMTVQIADAIDAGLNPQGTAVIAEAQHSCMACRGAKTSGVVAVTSALHGLLRWDGDARAEALALMGVAGRRS
jgi:GTP cyclohydrolase I